MKNNPKLSQNKDELLLNTINFYNKNNRGVDGSSCVYINRYGDRCAIGREISKEIAEQIQDEGGGSVHDHWIFSSLPKRL